MGADIHIIVERLDGGKWSRVWSHSYDKPDTEGTPECFRNRNYDLFGILGDVRNGYGFAGVPTGSGWPSIAPHRGIPDDSTLTQRERNGEYIVGDHSFSWVGLDELKTFDWDGVSAESYGVVEMDEYARMQREGDDRPKQWCGGISGGGVRIAETPSALLDAKGPKAFTHVRLVWKETAREATGDWAGQVLPWLESLADGRPLRLVFGFDS